ncbi:MAG: hypothetical protein GX621_05210, partial [Pirellulaceae bacterium]|nr:hypothetical protein [Pirellulaceae bacterium]
MKRLLSKVSLARLTLAVWLAWLVTIVITAWLSLSGVLHPSFLYMAIPLALMLLCTLGLVLGGIWRIVRGPGRYRALVWILVGVLPGLLTAAYLEHLFLLAAGGGIRLTWPVRASTSVASLLAEPYVRTCYPHRHESRRCVMWSASPERNDVVLGQMDEHIEHMETLLGERSNDKAYWVRGPVWGLGSRYGVGWVLGSVQRDQHYDWVAPIDRHEAAHFALNQLLPPDHELPLLFQEGWAELYTGGGGTSNWREFWLNLRNGKSLSLRELLSRDSYYRAEVPTYQQGCVLVDHLLRRFGHAKFLEFCQTCREATFDEDLQR